MKRLTKILFVFLFLIISIVISAGAEEKTWGGAGDGETWADDDNWYPAVKPGSQDDAVIDTGEAAVKCTSTFKAKSISIGARENAVLTSENFVSGTVAPESTSDTAISNNKYGKIILKGAGTLTMAGQYLDSQGTLEYEEPTFIFWIQ